ncbi:receptor-type tyrosine-protein phosphatase C-like isoform X2 [Salmo trutta]|uniref:receptor-type tyrosine-protein phosphatase C-like isoform X2 n=1 Tax=Salmo trutta TaxID=8032 RepID=UPI00113003B7|nr:receptor-type tyrosine-protein phosphatase C-like isoform X2 [Salmo trutta]
MAGLYGLKILLLCTGLIELAICDVETSSTGSTAEIPPQATVAITNKPPSIPTTTLNSQTASNSATPPPIKDQDKSSISTPSPTQPTKNVNDSTGPLLPNTTTITTTTTTTLSPPLSLLTPTSNIITLNQTQAFPTNTSTSQTQALPTNNSTSPSPSLPTNNSTSPSPSLPTSTPPIHKQTSPASTLTSTTAIPTGSQTKPTPPKCTYTVKPVKYGFQIDLIPSTNDTYNISYQDETRQTPVWRQLVNPTREVKSLKPCSIYTLMEIQPACELEGNRTLTTWKLEEDDIVEDIDCIPGSICYLSDWDISEAIPMSVEKSQMRSHTCRNRSNKLCFELRPDDFCSEVNRNFAPETCANFTKTKLIPVESFLHAQKIVLVPPERLPAEIKWENEPMKCNGTLAINYTCKEQKNNILKTSELEPFTNYTCTGRINHANRTIENTTSFRIECDVVIKAKKESTNISISLEWEISSVKCRPSDLQHLTYNCCCENSTSNKPVCSKSKTKKCVINGLDAYTNYACSIQPVKYKETTINIPKKVLPSIQTATGVPDMVDDPNVTWTQNNAFIIKCTPLQPNKWRGKERLYIATITGSGLPKTQKHKNCSFTFEDLSYLTDYTVQIFTHNGKHQSKPREKHIVTRSVIGFLVFLIVLMSLALFCKIILQRKKSNITSETKTTVMFISGTVPLPRGFRLVKTDAWYTLT